MTDSSASDVRLISVMELRLAGQRAIERRASDSRDEATRLAIALVHSRREMLKCVGLIDEVGKRDLSEDEYETFEAEFRTCLGEILTHLVDTETFKHDVRYFADADPGEWEA